MPRGHKSKRCAPKKHPKGKSDKKGGEVAEEAVTPTAEAVAAEVEAAAAGIITSSNTRSSSKNRSSSRSCSSKTRRGRSLIFFPEPTRSDLGSSCKYEECLSEISHGPDYLSEDTKCPIEALEWFILSKFHLKQPFTRLELLLSVNQKYRIEFPEMFKNAREHLEAMFAVELREVDSYCHSYNLFSMLSLPNNGRVRPGRGYPKCGLLMKILALILMKDHRASEEDVWKFLRRMQVYPDKRHIFFGNAMKLLTHDFVRLKYLEYRQVPGCLFPHWEFLWGPQACTETNKEKIMKFLIRTNKSYPTYFSSLYEDCGSVEIEKFHASISANHISTVKPMEVASTLHLIAFTTPISV
nr:melanoma-associated antigen B5-like [Cavia porcellus]